MTYAMHVGSGVSAERMSRIRAQVRTGGHSAMPSTGPSVTHAAVAGSLCEMQPISSLMNSSAR